MRFVVVILTYICVFLGILSSASGQQSDAVVKEVSYRTGGDGIELVEFQLNGPNIPQIFMMDEGKPRLVLDFAGTSYAGKSTVSVVNGIQVRGIRVGFHTTPKLKTRVVIDLVEGSNVAWTKNFEVHKNLLSISITGAEKKVTQSAAPVIAPANAPVVLALEKAKVKVPQVPVTAQVEKNEPEAESTPEPAVVVEKIAETVSPTQKNEDNPVARQDTMPVLIDVSFDNEFTKSGEMVLLKLNNFQPPVISTEEKDPPRIYCDFANASIGDGLKNEIDIGGKFVEKIRIIKDEKPAGVRVVLDLVVGNNYDLQQVYFKEDNLFVLIVNLLEEE